jgi:3-hydroxymyristoyl/3-hydroxydecanoyl-(acyl carrier protein) dehydratase
MAGRFSAFSFVDRILEIEPGIRATGRYTIPPGLARFPDSLVAEAVGQLAAWAAMSRLDFRVRPVAGIAGDIQFVGVPAAGLTLDLAVEIRTCDGEAVDYDGSARANGAPILELQHCVGPMLPMEEFDAPDAVRSDFELLCGAGARPGRFAGVAERPLKELEHVPGERLRAELRVPESAPFFTDHFPRRSVFPATLLLDDQIEVAVRLARGAAALRGARALAAVRVTDMKIRSFIPPGQVLELQGDLLAASGERATVRVVARADGKPVSTGRAEIAPRETP